MLKIIIPTIMLIPTAWLSKTSVLWINSTSYSLLITLIGLFYLNKLNISNKLFSNFLLSSPLLVLTTWLLPLMITASQHHLKNETATWKNYVFAY